MQLHRGETAGVGKPFSQIAQALGKLSVADPAANPEDMRGLALRIEFDVIPAATPGVTRVSQEIVHLVQI